MSKKDNSSPSKQLMYDGFLETISKEIEAEFNRIWGEYNFEYGVEYEIALCELLRKLLPRKYGICRGYVVTQTGEKEGDDIIIYDRVRFPVLRVLDESFVRKQKIPVEAVYAYIEAKHTIHLEGDENDGQSLEKACSQVAKVKALPRADRPLETITPHIKVDGKVDWTNGPDKANPFFGAIFSRRVKLKKGKDEKYIDDPSQLQLALEGKIPGVKTSSPDLLVVGSRVVILPTFERNDEKQSLRINGFLKEGKKEGKKQGVKTDLYVVKTQPECHALAVGICQLLWSLDMIRLGTIRWEEVIFQGLEKQSLRASPTTSR